MTEVEFHVPDTYDLAGAEELIEKACAKLGLIVAMKGSLKGYPGCTHWHYKKDDQKGTLELTLYAKERRIWAQVQDGRRAPWIDVELRRLKRAIEERLRQGTGSSLRKPQV